MHTRTLARSHTHGWLAQRLPAHVDLCLDEQSGAAAAPAPVDDLPVVVVASKAAAPAVNMAAQPQASAPNLTLLDLKAVCPQCSRLVSAVTLGAHVKQCVGLPPGVPTTTTMARPKATIVPLNDDDDDGGLRAPFGSANHTTTTTTTNSKSTSGVNDDVEYTAFAVGNQHGTPYQSLSEDALTALDETNPWAAELRQQPSVAAKTTNAS